MRILTSITAGLASGIFTVLLASSCAVNRTGFVQDGRLPINELFQRVENGLGKEWQAETLYQYSNTLAIRSWRTAAKGPALWILAGLHGEEPAGPNAIAANIDVIQFFAAQGIPVVLIPVGNPMGYHNNWRYPNTANRDWRKGGYSVGDSEYLLPDTKSPGKPRSAATVGPESFALTQFVLRTAKDYPPQLVLDLHEDELSRDGGYVYSQGTHAEANPVGLEIIRVLQQSGIPLRLDGTTRFNEPIRGGMISRDADNMPIRDGSIDELLAANEVVSNGASKKGPSSKTVIVVETPAYSGAQLEWRVKAQGSVLQNLPKLWALNLAVR